MVGGLGGDYHMLVMMMVVIITVMMTKVSGRLLEARTQLVLTLEATGQQATARSDDGGRHRRGDDGADGDNGETVTMMVMTRMMIRRSRLT